MKLSVVNVVGEEVIAAMLGPGDSFGEGCLADQEIHIAAANAITPTTVLAIDSNEMVRVLHREHVFSDLFIKYMLSRNIRIEADLIDQLFSSTEKRLARTRLLLAQHGKEGQPQMVLSKISQETLAEMIGTSRSRVNLFMSKFRKLGYIHNHGGLHVDSSLLVVIPPRVNHLSKSTYPVQKPPSPLFFHFYPVLHSIRCASRSTMSLHR